MSEVRRVKTVKMFSIVQEILDQGGCARITVTGMSMYPFLRGDIDSVELSKSDFKVIRRGDIVLSLRKDGQYILHRVYRKENNCFYILGDAQLLAEGPLVPKQMIAVVKSVWRGERLISCTGISWRLLSTIWLWMKPFRGTIIKVCRGVRRFVSLL